MRTEAPPAVTEDNKCGHNEVALPTRRALRPGHKAAVVWWGCGEPGPPHGRGGAPLGAQSATLSHHVPTNSNVPERRENVGCTHGRTLRRAGRTRTPASAGRRTRGREPEEPRQGDAPGRRVHGVSGSGLPGPGGGRCPWGWRPPGVTEGLDSDGAAGCSRW